jgi:5'-phosphate synthase pdxT subunit
MIVMAGELTDHRPTPLSLMDTVVSRNAFGRQVDSFESDLDVNGMDGPPYRAVFIRAPVFVSVGESVEVLASLDDGRPVAVKQGHMLATAFHPELTDDARMHKLFVGMVQQSD